MTANQVGREPFVVVEIEQQKCENVYGQAPCTANESVKCYNTRRTCQDPQNYQGSASIKWRFIKDNSQDGSYLLDASDTLNVETYGIPCLVSTNTTPIRLNIGSSSRNSGALGTRATLTATFKDIAYNDQFADDYLISRTYNPLSQGTFWGKWLARNPYYQNSIVRIYEGYYGQTLDQMPSREYIIDSINRDSRGNVTLRAKDPLILADVERAEIPTPSNLRLSDPINDTQTNINIQGQVFTGGGLVSDLDPIGIGDLNSYITVNDEIIQYQGYVLVGQDIGQLQNVVRGAFNTTPSAHDADDKCQRILRYVDAEINNVLIDVFSYTKIPTVFNLGPVNPWYSQWLDEYADYQNGFTFTGSITEPKGVLDVLGNMLKQANAFMFWNERTKIVEYRVNRPARGSIQVLDDEANIIEDSLSIQEKPEDRKSRAIYYYNYDYNLKTLDRRDSIENYQNVFINIDVDAESEQEYNEIKPFNFFADFVNQQTWAETNASLLLSKYVDTPRYCTIQLDAKDGALWIGDVVDINTRTDQNFDGSANTSRWQIISAQETISGELITYTLQSFQFTGRFGYWTSDNYPVYTAATQEQKDNGFFWSDDDGLMSDGTEGYKWQI